MEEPSKHRRRSSGSKRGANPSGGIRGQWGGTLKGRNHAQFYFKQRMLKKEAQINELAKDHVREKAREILQQEFGGKLPEPVPTNDKPIESTNILPNVAETILTSTNQRELMQDMDLLARATSEQWELGDLFKKVCVARLKKLVANENIGHDLLLKAITLAAKLDSNNMKWYEMANPQKHQHEHVHVELEQPNIDEQRRRLIDAIHQLGLSGTTGRTGEDAGFSDDPKLIEVRKEPS